ncbi:hypothetical protein MTO96_015050 [Rhipicephalus appendiculatus]
MSPSSKEGSLLELDQQFEMSPTPRRHRSPFSGTFSASTRFPSPRSASQRPGPGDADWESPASPPSVRDRLLDFLSLPQAEVAHSRKVRRGIVALLVVLIVLFVVLVYWNRHAIFGAQAFHEESEHSFCASVDCVKALSRIRSSQHESADPCTDFYEYTCGRWTPLDPEGAAVNYTDELYRNYTNSLFRLLERGDNDTLRGSGRSIANFYSSCVRFLNTPNQQSYYGDSLRELRLTNNFWQGVNSFEDVAVLFGSLCVRGGMPSFVNVTIRNAMLQMDVGTTLAAAMKPFHLTVADAAEFVGPYVGGDFHNFTGHILDVDAEMEESRAAFDRKLPFYAPRYKNQSLTLAFLYLLALNHSDNTTRRVMEGTLLVRGIEFIEKMVQKIMVVNSSLSAVYLYMVASSQMLGYAISRHRQVHTSRGQASLSCVYAVLTHYHSAFLHWAARFLQSRYSVDAAQKIQAKILNQFVKLSPSTVKEDVRVLVKGIMFYFYADPSTETYSKQAKVDMPYTPDNFLRNLVLYARSPSKVSVHWTPFQKTTKLELTTRLVYEKQLHVVLSPMYLTEDFFYADAFETSLNLATLGSYVAGVVLGSIDSFAPLPVRKWKSKVEECQRANLRALGWMGASDDAGDLDYSAEIRLSVAYGAAFGEDKTFEAERSKFFFQRFALAHCALNATSAMRMSIQYAVRRMPHFAKTFGCKTVKFSECDQ